MIIELKERLDKMSDSQISDICKRMKINRKNDKNKKIKTLLLPLISSYSFGDNDNITVTFIKKEFPEYDVKVGAKDTGDIRFEYNVCRDTFVKILTEIKNARDTDNAFGVFSKIIENRKEFCEKFSEHVNSITKVCGEVQTSNRIFKILPNPITCERLR
jgi:hypothetical protein